MPGGSTCLCSPISRGNCAYISLHSDRQSHSQHQDVQDSKTLTVDDLDCWHLHPGRNMTSCGAQRSSHGINKPLPRVLQYVS